MLFLALLLIAPAGYMLLGGVIISLVLDRWRSRGYEPSWILHVVGAALFFLVGVAGFALVGVLIALRSYFTLPAIIAPWIVAPLIWFWALRVRDTEI